MISLGLLALAQAAPQDYALKCAAEEMGIRWPSYKNNAEYYVCHRVGGKPVTMSCKPGEIFTFVLQICVGPSRYIPAPELSVLPTAAPVAGHNHHEVIKPLEISNSGHPPILSVPSQVLPQIPPMMSADVPRPPMISVVDNHVEEEAEKEHKEIEPVAVEAVKPEEAAAAVPPMPPTPAPTPPVVDIKVEETGAKAPVSIAKKPTAEKKKSSAKPSKSGKKKPSEEKGDKKSAKKPSKTSSKPAKTAKGPKKPTTSAKKTSKAPNKA